MPVHDPDYGQGLKSGPEAPGGAYDRFLRRFPILCGVAVALAASVVLFLGCVIASQFPDAEVVSVSPLEK